MKSKKKDALKGIKLNFWQIGIFKLSTISFGILLGIYFFPFLSQYVELMWFLCVVPGLYIVYLWLKQ